MAERNYQNCTGDQQNENSECIEETNVIWCRQYFEEYKILEKSKLIQTLQ